MPQRRYTIDINNKPFDFDWANDAEPTDAEIIDLYKKSLVPKPKPAPIAKPRPNMDVGFKGINSPIVDVTGAGRNISDAITTPRLNESPYTAMFKGMLGGMAEGASSVISELSNPIDMAAMATGLAPINNLRKVAPIITGARGLYNMGAGAMDGNSGQVGVGALETGMSALGMKPRNIMPKGNVQPITQMSTMPPSSVPAKVQPIIEPVSTPKSMPNLQVDPIGGGLTSAESVTRLPGGPTNNPDVTGEFKPLYGIDPKTNRSFPTVPDRLRGPSPTQTYFDSMLPSRTKELIGQTVKLPKDNVNSANKAIDNIPEVIKTAKNNPVPEIAKAANDIIKQTEVKPKLVDDDKSLRKGLAPYIKSGLSSLESDSEAGKSISKLVQRTRIEGEKLAGGWSNKYKEITKDLEGADWESFVSAVEGKTVPYDSKVLKAVLDYRRLDDEVVAAAKDSKMVMSDYEGNSIPFEGSKDYWPRIYGDEFLDTKRTDIFDQLIKEGNSPKQAEAIMEASKKFGNRLISPQHKRQADIGGYRTDKEAYLLHLDQMGKRIAESKNLGPNDLGDVNSPLSQLVGKTRDKKYTTEILNKHLGRTKPEAGMFVSDKWAQKANSLAAMTDLGLFTISNQAQKAAIPIRGDLVAFGKALKKFKTQEGKDWAERSGALQTALRDSIQDLGGESWVSKLYRTGASERSNRTLASLTGKFTAEADLQRFKKGDAKAGDRLKELLLLDNVDDLKDQEFLSEDQLYTAGSRMSEMTQGRAGSIDLPPKWKDSPEAKLMTMYKGYAFRTTKAMKDAFLDNPGKFLVVGLPLLAMTGEVVGDVKAGIRGALADDKTVEDSIGSRGEGSMVDKILKSANTPEAQRKLASRVIENLSEAWMLGILGDMIGSSAEGPTGLIKFIAGPVVGMASDIAGGASSSVTKLDVKPIAKSVTKNLVPAPLGYPLSQKIKGNESKKKASMLPRLPSLK